GVRQRTGNSVGRPAETSSVTAWLRLPAYRAQPGKNAMVSSVASRPSLNTTSMLRNGSEGLDVRALQQQLADAGYQVRVDGDFGPETERAVRAFQRDTNCKIDGIVGPETFAALQAGHSSVEPQSAARTRRASADTVGTARTPQAPRAQDLGSRPA